MENEGPKKRGRKKKIIEIPRETENNKEILQIEQVKKKRGRKKKWEVETTTKLIDNNPISFSENYTKCENKSISENYEEKNISFGNLNIKVHSNKEIPNIVDIKKSLKDSNGNSTKNVQQKCNINLTISDYEDSDTDEKVTNKNKKIIERTIKVMKFYKDDFDKGNEILISPYRCYNCHHTFNNKPFFLPIYYNPEYNKFKVIGNYCSPNCVKAAALHSKIYDKKAYLVSQMYRRLYGNSYIIKAAPPIQCLKEYGGTMSIQQYRESFDNNIHYKLKDLCSKIVLDEIIIL